MQLPKITRRRLLKGGLGAVAGGVGLYGYARYVEPHWLEVTRHDMALRDLPERWVGRRLVHVTDLHLGRRVDSAYLRASMRAVMALSPKIVAISGDLVDQERPKSIREIVDLLTPVVESGARVIASLGNHDYGWGWKRTTFAEEMAGVLRDAGVAVLRNERVEVDGLHVLGMDDLWAGRYRPEAAIAGAADWRAGDRAVAQPRHGGHAGVGRVHGLGAGGPHARRAVQAAVPAPAGVAGGEPPLHRRPLRPHGRPDDVHLPGRGSRQAGTVQLPPGASAVHAGPGEK